MLQITDTAASIIKEVLAQNKQELPDAMVRVLIAGYGWGGPKLQLTLDESQAEHDTVQEYREIKVVYSPQLKQYLDDVVIDYVDTIYQRGFTFKAPGLSTC